MKINFKKLLCCLVFVIGILFTTVVEAASLSSFSLSKGANINYDQSIVSSNNFSQSCKDGGYVPIHFPNKYTSSGNYLILCTGNRSADAGSNYTKGSFSSAKQGAGVAAIIANGVGAGVTTQNTPTQANQEKIFLTQIAVWKYLGQDFNCTEYALNSTQKTKFNSLVSSATAAASRYDDIAKFAENFKLDATKLNFTLNGDVYESQVIKVLGKEIKTKTPSVTKGTVVEKDGGYVVKVAKNLLSEGKNTITFKVEGVSNSIDVAVNYTSGNSSQQTTTTSLFDSFYKTDSETISGDITVQTGSVSISKQDATTGKELEGAKLVLTGPNNFSETWESKSTPKVFTDLAAGTYTLTETLAPNGYIKSSETITFEVDSNGNLVGDPVVMKNSPKDRVYISKRDATTGEELEGAELVLKDSKGKIIDSWTSEKTPHKVKVVLEAGEYYLSETTAPDGYEKSTETVTFTVNNKGQVEKEVIMYNMPKEIDDPPKTGSTLMYSLLVAFVAFAVSFYYYADYILKSK